MALDKKTKVQLKKNFTSIANISNKNKNIPGLTKDLLSNGNTETSNKNGHTVEEDKTQLMSESSEFDHLSSVSDYHLCIACSAQQASLLLSQDQCKTLNSLRPRLSHNGTNGNLSSEKMTNGCKVEADDIKEHPLSDKICNNATKIKKGTQKDGTRLYKIGKNLLSRNVTLPSWLTEPEFMVHPKPKVNKEL